MPRSACLTCPASLLPLYRCHDNRSVLATPRSRVACALSFNRKLSRQRLSPAVACTGPGGGRGGSDSIEKLGSDAVKNSKHDTHSRARERMRVSASGGAEAGEAPKEPVVLRLKDEVRAWSRACAGAGETVGLVPTMGYLHEGHLSLVEYASKLVDKVIVSVYVNPGQFAPGEDLDVYPRDPKGDLAKLSGLCDAVFMPERLYPASEDEVPHETWVEVTELQKPLCGASRPIFFRGVATVVAKLFNIVEPDIAVFGKKDYQQLLIIQRMVRDLDFAVKVVGMPLVREPDGLAMSSRNVRLSPEQRIGALSISRGLNSVRDAVYQGCTESASLRQALIDEITSSGGDVDYVQVVDTKSLAFVQTIDTDVIVAVAARFGDVRLIDNIEIDRPT